MENQQNENQQNIVGPAFAAMVKDELVAHIDLYRRAGIEIPSDDDLSNNEKRVAFLESTLEAHGIAHEVNQDDLDQNASGVDGHVLGDVILVKPTVAPAGEGRTDAAADAAAQSDGSGIPAGVGKGVVDTDATAAGATPGFVQYYYQKKPVVSVTNKLVNGRTYKELVLADSVALLTEDEFVQQVTQNP